MATKIFVEFRIHIVSLTSQSWKKIIILFKWQDFFNGQYVRPSRRNSIWNTIPLNLAQIYKLFILAKKKKSYHLMPIKTIYLWIILKYFIKKMFWSFIRALLVTNDRNSTKQRGTVGKSNQAKERVMMEPANWNQGPGDMNAVSIPSPYLPFCFWQPERKAW